MKPPEPLDFPALEGDVRREKLKVADGEGLKDEFSPGGEQGLTGAFIRREGLLRQRAGSDSQQDGG
ncbi:hypothetical protein MVI01_74100 [Myxococcus virescens]|uniref:Uncharacterized protein n=1 Tax=Myxococcus virescens TaxID=83456 RepID=A0A511HPV6_9BACT|nr:hypothetical protein MVI01_74100 [Myxococcus virescens]